MSHLYKYRSLSKAGDARLYTGRMITHQELYFSHARSFNDPFDCMPVITLNSTKKEFEEYLKGFFERTQPGISRADKIASVKAISNDPKRNHKSKQALEVMKEGFEQAMSLAGVLSLSETNSHVLMWSHYAECHSGICLQFKRCNKKGFFTEANKVIYHKSRPVFNLIKGNHEEISRDALLSKADFWSYENEWRLINPKRPPGVHRYPSELLEGVILGAKISDEDKDQLKEWISTLKHQVKLFQATINEKNFRIDINEI